MVGENGVPETPDWQPHPSRRPLSSLSVTELGTPMPGEDIPIDTTPSRPSSLKGGPLPSHIVLGEN